MKKNRENQKKIKVREKLQLKLIMMKIIIMKIKQKKMKKII